MDVSEAVRLIEKASIGKNKPTTWVDLGCGNGVFTRALAEILPVQGTIYAIDKDSQTIDKASRDADIRFVRADFEKAKLALPPLDGILMANSLHYVADKKALLLRLQRLFRDEGKYIIVEYDTKKSNRWVPYPIPFDSLKSLFLDLGFSTIEKLAVKRSIYGQGTLYTCFISQD